MSAVGSGDAEGVDGSEDGGARHFGHGVQCGEGIEHAIDGEGVMSQIDINGEEGLRSSMMRAK